MSHPDHHRLRLRLDAAGRPKLFDLLLEAVGAIVADRFEIVSPLATGSHSHVFFARDRATGEPVVVKQPAFDYSRPIAHSRASVAAARERLRAEHEVLVRCPTHHMPRLLAVITSQAVVRSALSSAVFGGSELFLVEEWIEGATLAEHALTMSPKMALDDRERQAGRVAREFILFSAHLLGAGWFYADVSAQNLIIKPGGALRVVDAGSAVKREDEVVVRGFTPAFTTPNLHHRLLRAKKIPATLSTILPLLAKVLHFALTRAEPLDGQLPKLELLGRAGCSYACARALEAMLDLDAEPHAIDRAATMLDEWGAWPDLA